MATKRHSSFRGKVGVDAHKEPKSGKSYLILPEGVKQYNIKEGTKKILFDILPYIVSDIKHPNRDDEREIARDGDLWYRRPFKIHRNVGVDKDTVICPKSVGKPCPICAYQKERYDAGATVDEVKDLYPSDRDLYAIIPLEQEGYEEVPHVWDMSERLFQDTLKDTVDEDIDKYEVFPDLEEGFTIEASVKWKTLGKVTFPEVTHIEFNERNPYKESILNDVPDLDTILNVLSFDEIKSKFFETVDEEDGGVLKPVREDHDREEKRERPSRRTEREPEEKTSRRERDSEPKPEEKTSRRTERPTERQREVSKDKDEADTVDERRRPERTTSRREPEKPAGKGSDKCPYGHRFGIDTEKFNDCDDCKLFDDCLDVKEAKR